ncbi:hypothetical protein AB0F81_19315 [Actinoplanes sp. NPDC024001]|uniref:tetratricopeptide repeat protein n=1 Tax=Actinoplanes sp. NPDC024001 TaxID=3154598 RepID=UPI0033D7828C
MPKKVAGVSLWPAVLIVWSVRLAAVLVPFAVVAGAVRWFRPEVGWWALLAGALAGALICGWVVRREPGIWPGRTTGLRMNLRSRPGDWELHARIARTLADRSPEQAEGMLRSAIEQGSTPAYRALLNEYFRHGRLSELDTGPIRARLLAAASQQELVDLVAMLDGDAYRDGSGVVEIARALVAMDPENPERHELLAAMLTRPGTYDEAMAVEREATRLRALDTGAAAPAGDWRLLTAHRLTRAGRLDDAETVLRPAVADPAAAVPLALLLQQQGRTAEGEALLREHPKASEPAVLFALFTLLSRDGRTEEAEALRPAGGWPHERARRRGHRNPVRTPGVTWSSLGSQPDPYLSIWGIDVASYSSVSGGSYGGGSDGGGSFGGGFDGGSYGGGFDGGGGSSSSGGYSGGGF